MAYFMFLKASGASLVTSVQMLKPDSSLNEKILEDTIRILSSKFKDIGCLIASGPYSLSKN
jgi:hypothetical protein